MGDHHSVAERLDAAVSDYLQWLETNGYSATTRRNYESILKRFRSFVQSRALPWEEVFTAATVEAFKRSRNLRRQPHAVRGLARYLFHERRIARPVKPLAAPLPAIYERYLHAYATQHQIAAVHLVRVRTLLSALHGYLEKQCVALGALRIESVDRFLAAHNAPYAPATHQKNRSIMRGFLRYAYHIERSIPRDLAALVVGAPLFAQTLPPKFLTHGEVEKLFSSQALSTPRQLRRYALLHIAYHLGLRPKEISLIRLDDISFTSGEIRLPDRKNTRPTILPVPESTIKAVAAYMVGARPRSNHRALFLSAQAPYNPLPSSAIVQELRLCFEAANMKGSAYRLRHTYAQHLLEADTSIFELKEMMGHDCIQTTRRYLHIHTTMMRKVLFDETV